MNRRDIILLGAGAVAATLPLPAVARPDIVDDIIALANMCEERGIVPPYKIGVTQKTAAELRRLFPCLSDNKSGLIGYVDRCQVYVFGDLSPNCRVEAGPHVGDQEPK